MKKLLTVAIATTLLSSSIFAQHANIGVKAGLNVYNIKNNNSVKYDSKMGLNAGLLAHIHLSKQIAFQPELLYSSQGAKYTNATIETKYNLDYLNVPLLIQYMFDNGFRLQAGPQVGFLLKAKSKTGNTETDFTPNLKSVDFSLGLGVGYIHNATGLGLDLRYNLGLSNINDNTTVKSYNNGLQIGVFYLIKNHK